MADDVAPLTSPPQAWLEALDRAEAEVAAGQTRPWPEVRADLLARLAALEARPARRKA